mmetsp:Transcript_2439/g.4262  ORF Transcript_2439/g.4262 Transcript_2439/m.4262 type:complete len:546 (-) Transcript_2439:58-1695(-)
MADYLPISLLRHAPKIDRSTAESRFWSNYRISGHLPSTSNTATSYVEFSPSHPHDLAASIGARVVLWDGISPQPRKTIARFKDNAYSSSFKKDGKLLISGGENALVQLFDLSSRAILRTFRGHSSAVHSTKFVNDGTHVISCSDDQSMKVWDVPTESCLRSITKPHSDYIRTQCASPSSVHLWATGCYDHYVRLFDLRSQSSKAVISLDHGCPLSDVMLLGGGALCVSAGGDEIRVWDLFAGGKLIKRLHSHAKAVTSLCLDSSGGRVISGGLDGHAVVHDMSSFASVYSIPFEGQILSVSASLDGTRVAAGLSDGSCVVRARGKELNHEEIAKSAALFHRAERNEFQGMSLGRAKLNEMSAPYARIGSKKYYQRGRNEKQDEGDEVVVKGKKPKMYAWDRHLRAFEYSAALDSVLASANGSVAVVSVLDELVMRRGLHVALEGRSEKEMIPMLEFLVKNVRDPKYSGVLLNVVNVVVDLYGSESNSSENDHVMSIMESEKVDKLWNSLWQVVKSEVKLQKELFVLQGATDFILSASTTSMTPAN